MSKSIPSECPHGSKCSKHTDCPDCPGFYGKGGVPTSCNGRSTQLYSGEPKGDNDRTERVVTFVHGTFARHADWMRDDSAICQGLKKPDSEERLCEGLNDLENTRLSRFCWTGGNSHSARLRAGEDLAIHVRQLIQEFPNAKQFIAGHSHGGNVAMYAMEEEDEHKNKLVDHPSIGGVITLATPFIVLRKRLLPNGILSSAWIAVAFTIVAFVCLLLFESNGEKVASTDTNGKSEPVADAPVDDTSAPGTPADTPDETSPPKTPESDKQKTEAATEAAAEAATEAAGNIAWGATGLLVILSAVWVLGTVLSTLRYSERKFELKQLFRLLIARKKVDADGREHFRDDDLEKQLDDMLKRLQPEGRISDRLLIVRPLGDEATMSLIVPQFMSWAQTRLLGFLQGTQEFIFRKSKSKKKSGCFTGCFGCLFTVITLVALLFAADSLLDKFPVLAALMTSDSFNKQSGWIQFVEILFIGLLALYVLFGFLSLIGLIGLLVAAAPVGWDAMFWNHFASTTSEASPQSAASQSGDLATSPAQIYVAGGSVASGLAHSGIYVHKDAIQEVMNWIRARSKN